MQHKKLAMSLKKGLRAVIVKNDVGIAEVSVEALNQNRARCVGFKVDIYCMGSTEPSWSYVISSSGIQHIMMSADQASDPTKFTAIFVTQMKLLTDRLSGTDLVAKAILKAMGRHDHVYLSAKDVQKDSIINLVADMKLAMLETNDGTVINAAQTLDTEREHIHIWNSIKGNDAINVLKLM